VLYPTFTRKEQIMNRRNLLGMLLALPFVATGVCLPTSYATGEPRQAQKAAAEGYVCPATGELLPCPQCCPLIERK
jgi:hypothetical protein